MEQDRERERDSASERASERVTKVEQERNTCMEGIWGVKLQDRRKGQGNFTVKVDDLDR